MECAVWAGFREIAARWNEEVKMAALHKKGAFKKWLCGRSAVARDIHRDEKEENHGMRAKRYAVPR